MAGDDGRVYVFVYVSTADAGNGNIASDSTSLESAATWSVRIQFVGEPAFGKDTNEDGNIVVSTTPADNEARSRVVITPANSAATANRSSDAVSQP